MNIHIFLNTDSELVAFETMNLAFLLASFDNGVQLVLGENTLPLFNDNARLVGMLKSLHLYDLPPAWVDLQNPEFWQIFNNDSDLQANLIHIPDEPSIFDSYLTF